ncbi:hypothetical protein CAPTEDRAFT_192024 [Capitella teleta]|uniref:Uncharacterized protein n=1 Tax=Capitella teleta TaxID=283909 RepID=R7TGE0_CAPTE|nr:hypothetical protein CAPTEDRAFT_192024 [Capitella teleta]|eukprot:ELT90636.1 hypothetical protein CAPTEDRAFT_192024 [Capitella teleta]
MERALREAGFKYNLGIEINQLKEEQLNESDEVYTFNLGLASRCSFQLIMDYILLNLARVTECGSEDELQDELREGSDYAGVDHVQVNLKPNNRRDEVEFMQLFGSKFTRTMINPSIIIDFQVT